MTTRYAVLLRGINVGGARKVPMADLRELLTGLGHGDVRTYLNSGNAAFSSDTAGEEGLAASVEKAIEDRFGFTVDCLVRSGAYLRAVADGCPFPAAELQGKQLHVTFFSGPVGPERFAALDQRAYLPEEFRLGDRVLYLYAPDGLGRSKLAEALNRPAVNKGITGTSRNWNTVLKLAELTAG
ncbi:DUF1697 domain-containing protein [Streptomyces sp. SID10853]|uniref:DUF1697 domain-containing protein n=1 Tax=Streptomyces sp. SID10853 TaxID=2706028 RepID=UPI0013BECE9B|nr:DUF1697 domain-containing protein [Streptomyces sp. SID10853]NDZ81388.1 DUF1697 domain-containing protein [Streptomyces sp. SID10853]